MIDGHIHFHKQPYTFEILEKMIEVAISKGVDELYLLDHTHKFKEFDFLYASIQGEYTKRFYQKEVEMQVFLKDYIDFITEARQKEWPIKLHFGLEVCFFNEHQKELEKYIESLLPFKFDFLIGSIHHVDGQGIDLYKEVYYENDVDIFYQHYFEAMENLIKSQYYTFLAHPDSIKLFGFYPSFSLTPYYEKIAQLLVEYNLETENNSGLIRHGYPYPGLNKEMLNIFKKYGVKFHRSSDAHKLEDIGRVFNIMEESRN